MLASRHVTIETHRFRLETIVTTSNFSAYLSWFQDDVVQQYILNKQQTLEELTDYVEAKYNADDCLFLGIYHAQKHIGNIKFEPIDFNKQVATLGILIGEVEWRGRGVASEVIPAVANWLKHSCGIEQFRLGVDDTNTAAVSTYTKLGFKHYESVDGGIMMQADIQCLQPE